MKFCIATYANAYIERCRQTLAGSAHRYNALGQKIQAFLRRPALRGFVGRMRSAFVTLRGVSGTAARRGDEALQSCSLGDRLLNNCYLVVCPLN